MPKTIANWGNYPKIKTEVLSFSNATKLDQILEKNTHIIPRGLGRCYGDASLSDHTILSTLKYDKILQLDEKMGIMEAQAGISFESILECIIPKGWFLPVTPGTKYITLGGAVASDIHGKNHHAEGSFSNHVQKLVISLPDGKTLECSHEKEADLFWATCGGMGLTGIIQSVQFRLKKIETSFIKQIQIKAKNLDHIIALFEEYGQFTYSMAWIDCLKGGEGFGRSIMMAGEHALVADLDPGERNKPLRISPIPKLSIPFNFPNFALNTLSVKAFNFLYYSLHARGKIEKITPYNPFFYPLDSILHWNRMYGKKGFVQYQFVLPLSESRKGLLEILSRIRKRGMGSFLAVLKLFGHQENLISFPMKGYTLALDFPIQKGLFAFLDELDQIVLSYGGRIYLTKDARMKAEIFWQSYPHSKEFQDIVRRYNPKESIQSLQSQRLGITQVLYKNPNLLNPI